MVAFLHPLGLAIDVAAALAHPVAAHPVVPAAAPVPVAGRPDVAGRGAGTTSTARRRRRDADVDADRCRVAPPRRRRPRPQRGRGRSSLEIMVALRFLEHETRISAESRRPGVGRRPASASAPSCKTAPADVTIRCSARAPARLRRNSGYTARKAPQCFGPAYRRCLVSLSRGGADANVVREFDVVDKRFVDGGFTLPRGEVERRLGRRRHDPLSRPTSGPARSPIPAIRASSSAGGAARRSASATTLFDVEASDVSAAVLASTARRDTSEPSSIARSPSGTRALSCCKGDKLTLDRGASTILDDRLHATTTLLIAVAQRLEDRRPRRSRQARWSRRRRRLPRGPARRSTVLFAPTRTRSLASWWHTRDYLDARRLSTTSQAACSAEERRGVRRGDGEGALPGHSSRRPAYDPLLDGVPPKGRPAVAARRRQLADRYWFSYVDFLTPDSLALASRRLAMRARC